MEGFRKVIVKNFCDNACGAGFLMEKFFALSSDSSRGVRLARLKNASTKQRDPITTPGLALLTLRYQLKRRGAFSSRFFQQTVFRPRAPPPPSGSPFLLYRKINNAALFSARKACTDKVECVCSRHPHRHTMHRAAIS